MHLNMSYSEVRGLPVRYRRWFIERLLKYYKDKNDPDNRRGASAENNRSLSQYQEHLDKKFGQ